MTAVCLTDSCLRDGTRAVRHQLATEQAGARLKEGKLEDERERLPRLVGFVQENEPRLLAFNEYANEEGTEVGVVQVHRDAESMEFHMKTVADRAARAYAETLEATTSIQVYGTPSEAVLQMLSRQAGAGVPLVVKRHHLGGFTRTPTD
jgi:hypothetical protein